MLTSIFGCFFAAFQSSNKENNSYLSISFFSLRLIYIFGFPLLVFSIIQSCFSVHGLGFWIFTPIPSVFFGMVIGRLFTELNFPAPTFLSFLTLILVSLGVLFYEFFTLPQVFFFNHVWGTWPGPIYDESVELTGRYIFFRGITFLWILLLWLIPTWSSSKQNMFLTASTIFLLMMSYLQLDEAKIISPEAALERELSSHHQTEHFNLYFDARFYTDSEIKYWSEKHEFYFQQIIQDLEIEWPQYRKIESFLYANAWQKKDLVGAKFTSYVPIWLETDQLHIAKQQLESVLKHEIVHAISKQFGNSLFNGSLSIGLIEGLAEAVSEDASRQSTLDQIVAAQDSYPSAEEMKSALSFSGFYGSAGSISYTTTGSFVRYLIQNHPIENLKSAYKNSSFDNVYSLPFEELVENWHSHLDTVAIDSVDRNISELIFSQRSLFQKDCPHTVSKELQLWDSYQYQLVQKDSSSAYSLLDDLYELDSNNDLVRSEWVRSQLFQQKPEKALTAFSDSDTLLTLLLLKGDALFQNQEFNKAFEQLESLKPRINDSKAPNFKFSYIMREDSLQWSQHISRRFLNQLPSESEFLSLNLANKFLALDKALELHQQGKVIRFTELLSNQEVSEDWFETSLKNIDQLIFYREFELAYKWNQKLNSTTSRARYLQRIDEQRDWLSFVQSY